jgi:hypothetical protein
MADDNKVPPAPTSEKPTRRSIVKDDGKKE